jgi:hypothetical protein
MKTVEINNHRHRESGENFAVESHQLRGSVKTVPIDNL